MPHLTTISTAVTEERVQRRIAAILVADVAEYARLVSANEEDTIQRLKGHLRELIEPRVADHGGRIVKTTGDGFLAEFASPVEAVRCALELQQGMELRNADVPAERRIDFRIGINLGDVVVDADDLHGEGVNVAARLESIAERGNVLVSGAVYEQVRDRLPIEFKDLGEKQLKNIARPVRVYRFGSEARVRTATSLPPLPEKPSIAVLPFDNLSGDPQQDYFADGVVEEIITALSRFPALFVIARNSSFIYKGRAVDVKQVGRELGVRYVLEGSLRKAANKVRITGQLIDAATGAHLWADRFDGDLEDIFALQDHVTASVVGALFPKLEQAEIERIKSKPTENLDAYDHYLRGMAGIHRWSKEGNQQALTHFYRAMELDPNYATPYGLVARAYVQKNAGGWSEDRERELTEVERVARRAAELGPLDAVALCTAGFGLCDVAHAIEDGDALIERALEINPNLSWAWLFSGWAKIGLGQPDVAVERLARAMRLSPQDPQKFSAQTAMACAHLAAGRYAEAVSWGETAMRERPNFALPIWAVAAGAALLGRIDHARRTLARGREIVPAMRLSKIKDFIGLRQDEDYSQWQAGLREAGLPD